MVKDGGMPREQYEKRERWRKEKTEGSVISQQQRTKQEGSLNTGHKRLKPGRLSWSPLCLPTEASVLAGRTNVHCET